jgi:2-amino-4-hydroxy-6-hydroxymethyldihydropteridine diphosphokinase
VVRQVQQQLPSRYLVVVAFGANQTSSLGKPRETIELACATLSERVGSPLRKSRLYQTPAFPEGAGPDFVNAVAAFETELSPIEVLAICHGIEEVAGRTREIRWGQRTLDIDLIAFSDYLLPDLAVHKHWRDLPLTQQTQRTPDQLIVPHPRLQDRAFVLVPMMEVAPDWIHPILKMTTRQLLDARPESEKASVCPLGVA